MTTPIDELAGIDPWQWLHDNEFSWDDVNAVAAILDAGGFDITRRSTPVPASNVSGRRPVPVKRDDETLAQWAASNVSEGLREARHESGVTIDIEAMLRQSFEDGRREGYRAALAHTAPERLDGTPWKSIALSLRGTLRGIANDRTVATIQNARAVAAAAVERADEAIKPDATEEADPWRDPDLARQLADATEEAGR